MKGFSLIEILVSLSIIFIVFGIVYPRYKAMEVESDMLTTSHEISQRLREAQDLAISGQKVDNGGLMVIPDGYGLYFDLDFPSEYNMYADLNNNSKFDETDKVMKTSTAGIGTTVPSFNIEDGVFLSDLGEHTSVSVNFSPPSPETTITAGFDEVADIRLKIGGEGTDSEEAVIVNKAGLIYICRIDLDLHC